MSGPDLEELKTVRKALQQCLKSARMLVLEREYLRFVAPDMEMFRQDEQAQESDNGEPEVHNSGQIVEEERKTNKSSSSRPTIVEADRESKLSMTSGKVDESFSQYKSPYLF